MVSPLLLPVRPCRSPGSLVLAAALAGAAGLALLALAGCMASPPPSAEGVRRCRLQAQQSWPWLRPLIEGQCQRSIEAALLRDRRQQEQQREQRQRRQEVQRGCLDRRQRIDQLVAELEGLEAELLRKQSERYPASAAPQPLTPEERRSLPIYDQELLDERHVAQLASWRSREEQRRAQWERNQSVALADLRARQSRAAEALQRLDSGLLAQASPPVLNAALLQQRRACP